MLIRRWLYFFCGTFFVGSWLRSFIIRALRGCNNLTAYITSASLGTFSPDSVSILTCGTHEIKFIWLLKLQWDWPYAVSTSVKCRSHACLRQCQDNNLSKLKWNLLVWESLVPIKNIEGKSLKLVERWEKFPMFCLFRNLMNLFTNFFKLQK